jgi:hypothetical protein
MLVESPLYRWLCRHALTTFLLMTASFVAFGYLTVDLIHLIGSNAAFILKHGWMALMSGGLLQLSQLILLALLAMTSYLIFRLSEKALLHRLSNRACALPDK